MSWKRPGDQTSLFKFAQPVLGDSRLLSDEGRGLRDSGSRQSSEDREESREFRMGTGSGKEAKGERREVLSWVLPRTVRKEVGPSIRTFTPKIRL